MTIAPVQLRGASVLAESVVRFARTLQALRAQHGAESAARSLLWPLQSHGPLRAGALAEAVHADASTVSRQVGELLKEGLVRRESDPDDGRASLLAVTESGHELLAEMCRRRDEMIADVLHGWTDDEVSTFSSLLTRFTDGLSSAVPTLKNPARLGGRA